MNDIEVQQLIKLLKLFRDSEITYTQAVKLRRLVIQLDEQLEEEIDYYLSQHRDE